MTELRSGSSSESPRLQATTAGRKSAATSGASERSSGARPLSPRNPPFVSAPATSDRGSRVNNLGTAPRVGTFAILSGIYLCLLAGSFNLQRIGGPDLPLTAITVPLLALACFIWRAPQPSRGPRSAAWPVLAINSYFLYMILTSLWSLGDSSSRDELYWMTTLALLLNLSAWVMSRSDQRVLDAMWILIWLTSLAFFVGSLFKGPGLQGRYAAFGGGPNVFVRIMILGALASLAIYLVRRTLWPLGGLPLFLAGAALSGSRGGLLALVAVLVGIVPLIKRLGLRGTLRCLVVLLFAGAILAVAIPSDVKTYLYNRFVILSLRERYTSGREEYYVAALRLFKQRPVIGWGLGSYQDLTGLNYAHNLALATASEGGLVGVALLLLGTFVCLYRVYRRRHSSPDSTLIGMLAAFSILIASMFSGGYYDSRCFWFFLIYAAYCSGLRQAHGSLGLPHTSPKPHGKEARSPT
jgi:O-antigen ligase